MSDEIARSADQLREQVDIERKAEREFPDPVTRKQVKAYAPALCDVCRGRLRTGKSFYDGRTLPNGQWAWMCSVCYEEHGIGLGPGQGQQYSSETNVKEAG